MKVNVVIDAIIPLNHKLFDNKYKPPVLYYWLWWGSDFLWIKCGKLYIVFLYT